MSALDLSDAMQHLNITDSNSDALLQGFIDSAEAAISRWVGPLEPTAVTQRVVSTGSNLGLSTLPAISLTSVTPYNGTALTISDLYLDTSTGVVVYQSGLRFWASSYTVVYQAGRSTVPDDLMLAIKELVRHLWTTQRGSGTSRPGASPSQESPVGAGFSMPNRVAELLAPHASLGLG